MAKRTDWTQSRTRRVMKRRVMRILRLQRRDAKRWRGRHDRWSVVVKLLPLWEGLGQDSS